MTKYILTAITLSFIFVTNAQNVAFKSSNFKGDKEGFKEATESIKKGDDHFESANEALEKVQNQLPEQPVEGTVCIRSTTPSSPIPPSLNVQKMIELKAMEVETVERATEEMVASLRTHLSDEIPQITSTFPAAPQNNIISNFNINSLNSNKFKEVEHIIRNIEEEVSEISLAPLPFQKYLPPDHALNAYKGCGDRFWGEHRFHKHPCVNMKFGCEFYALVCKSCKKGVSIGADILVHDSP